MSASGGGLLPVALPGEFRAGGGVFLKVKSTAVVFEGGALDEAGLDGCATGEPGGDGDLRSGVNAGRSGGGGGVPRPGASVR